MTHQYRFGDLLIDEQSFRLLQADKPLTIEPKALNLLIFLVQHPGRLIERRELLAALWGDAFVTDHVLNRSIGQLRRVLGDDPREPRYIETVPTLGYRFIASVETTTLESSSPAPASAGQTESQFLPSRAAAGEIPTTSSQPTGASSPTSSKIRPAGLSWLLLAACLISSALAVVWIRHRRPHGEETIRSLAVLPLDDLSPGPREDYFADGMTDELITELARVPGLRVVSRTSVMQDKGAHKPLARLARELDVDAIVEGSIVRSGDRVRITAQLIDARNDKHLWAHTFEGPLGDILSLQDSVAREIALQTSAALTPEVRTELATAKHVDPAAHDAYLRGLYFIQRRDGSLASSYFQKAIALQPGYAAANAGLAEALVTQALTDGKHAGELMPPAIAAANRAIQLDPRMGEAYTALGAIDATYLWDWSGAEQNLRKGIELSPSSSDAETWYAVFLTSVGRPGEAMNAMQRAVALNPSSFWANRLLGSTLYYARHYDDALYALQRSSEIAPDKFAFVEGWKADIFEMQGRYSDAIEADLKDIAAQASPQDIASLRSSFRVGGWKAYQEARVKVLLPRSMSECEMNPLAMSYVSLGNTSEAIRWFGHDLSNRCGRTVFDLASDPRLDPIRGDPRFRALLRRINLPY